MLAERILLEWISGKLWTAIIFAMVLTGIFFKHFITIVSLCIRKIGNH
jgi:hypothetical protein